MARTSALLLAAFLTAQASAQGYLPDRSGRIPRLGASAQIEIEPPFLWEYAETPYGYPKGQLYTSPEGTFSALFGDPPAVHQLRPMGTPMLLYQGMLKHREDLASNVHVHLMPGLKSDDAALMRTFVLDSHKAYAASLKAKTLRLAIRDHTPGGGPMILEFEVEYKLEDIPMRSCGFSALQREHTLRAYAQYCPLLNAEEIAIARHFPTTVSLPGVDALNLAASNAEPATATSKSSLYQKLEVDDGVTLDVPSNWKRLSDSTRQTMDAARVARETAATGEPLESKLPFAANLYGDGGHVLAMANLRFYYQMTMTQANVLALDGELLQAIDDLAREETEKNMRRLGQEISWLGARRVALGDLVAIVCSYERKSADLLDHFCVRLVRIHDGPRSFTLTLSHRKSQTALLKPICDHIMRSLRRKPAQSMSSPSESKK
jgi:hypothetical protein